MNLIEVTFEVPGEVPRKVGPKYNGRWVYIPQDTKALRKRSATQARKALKGFVVKQLTSVYMDWVTKQPRGERPDADTLYHQVQDALTKDAFKIDDNGVHEFCVSRVDVQPGEGQKPKLLIQAGYECEEQKKIRKG